MREHRGVHSVRRVCRALRISRSGYYAARRRPVSAAAQRRSRLVAKIRVVHAANRQRYGSPRVHAELLAGGERCCVKTVARLMRAHQLRARMRRKYRMTTDSAHPLPVSPNRLGRDFHRRRPNQAWVADITYIPTGEGWLYLATELDLHSRRVVGWAMSDRMTSQLVIDALEMAVQRRRPEAGLLHHSDRGSQYAGQEFQSRLKRHGMLASMSGRADCYDNAVMESFFGTLKKELVNWAAYATRAEARVAIFEYLEVYYNRQRRHSTLGYLTPDEYESRAA